MSVRETLAKMFVRFFGGSTIDGDKLIHSESIFWIFHADSLNIFPRTIDTTADSRDLSAAGTHWFLAHLQDTTRCDAQGFLER